MAVHWSPDVPDGFKSRRAFRRLFDAYIEARAEFLEIVATTLGGNVGVVDIDAPNRIGVVRPGTKH